MLRSGNRLQIVKTFSAILCCICARRLFNKNVKPVSTSQHWFVIIGSAKFKCILHSDYVLIREKRNITKIVMESTWQVPLKSDLYTCVDKTFEYRLYTSESKYKINIDNKPNQWASWTNSAAILETTDHDPGVTLLPGRCGVTNISDRLFWSFQVLAWPRWKVCQQ